MTSNQFPVQGAGVGLRRALMGPLSSIATDSMVKDQVDFMEVAPENWINVGGRYGKQFREYTERFPFVCHGLSLSIGSPAPLDWELIGQIKNFMKEHQIRYYTEHLTYCSDDAHLYDLMPIPFTEEAINYTVDRICQIQDFLGQRIAMENASYYAAPQQEMSEIDFINAVLEKADCGLLLDVNNIYVNSINHRYDAEAFLKQLPGERVAYVHVAGHYVEAEDLRVDTHGADVIDPVWQLLDKAYEYFGVMPTLLERDFNIPPVNELLAEVGQIKQMQNACVASGGVSSGSTTSDSARSGNVTGADLS